MAQAQTQRSTRHRQPATPEQQTLEELQTAIREAHSTLRALNQANKDARRFIATIREKVSWMVTEELGTLVDEGVQDFGDAAKRAMEDVRQRVEKDVLEWANKCMYGNKSGKGENVFERLREEALRLQLKTRGL